MTARHDLVRAWLSGDLRARSAMASVELKEESEGAALGIPVLQRMFFPDLEVRVDELFDVPGDRVGTRLTLTAGGRSWHAFQLFRFRDEELVGIWTVYDSVPVLAALGALDEEALDRRLDELAASAEPPPSA